MPLLASDFVALSGRRISRQTESTAVLQKLAFTPVIHSGASFRLLTAGKNWYFGAENICGGHHKRERMG
ncbi:hypothetical protein TNCV_3259371 [Trichonephila clavipes]|nr:hypothetical protein TNCV_3259371 [Trichonephila clavipes]